MTKVWCPSVECVHNKNQRCTEKELKFKYRNMLTVNDGRQDMWVCGSYELSEESQEIMKRLQGLMGEKFNG